MSLHAFGPHGHLPIVVGGSFPPPSVVTDRGGLPGGRSFVVRVRFATPAARAGGCEVVSAEAWVGGAGGAGRLASVVESGLDLLILVEDAANPDAALGVATEALRESLVGFRVAMVGPADGAMQRVA